MPTLHILSGVSRKQGGEAFLVSHRVDYILDGKRKTAAYVEDCWRDKEGRKIQRAAFTSEGGGEVCVFIDGKSAGRGPKVRLDVDSGTFAQIRVGGRAVAEFGEGKWHRLSRSNETRKWVISGDIVIGAEDCLLEVEMPWEAAVSPGVRSRLSALA